MIEENWIVEIFKEVFGDEYLNALESIMKPTYKYYLRVNKAVTDHSYVIEELRKEGIEAKLDEFFDDALYIEGYEEDSPELLKGYVVARIDAAESVSEGADLYRPGAISIHNAEKGSKVSVVTGDLKVAAEGILMMDNKEFSFSKKGLVVKNIRPKFKRPSIKSLKTYQKGLIYPQSFPSIITVHELEPKGEEVIIDMCSSPGGKLSHIIAMTKGKAKIIACDKTASKIERIKDTLSLLRLPFPELIKCDARFLSKLIGEGKADKILLDPSCTNLGLRPRITLNLPKKDPRQYSEYQKSLLREAYKLLKKGGVCVFSVCTISKEETFELLNFSIDELKVKPLPLKYSGEYMHLFKPHKEDTPGYAIFKVMKI